MRKIVLMGALGKKFGRVHKFDIRSPAEGIRALCANYPEFQRDLMASEAAGVGYRVVADKTALDAVGDLGRPFSREVRIVPVLTGAGGTFGKILLGAAIIAVAWEFAPEMAVMADGMATGATTTAWGASIASFGGMSLTYGNVALFGGLLALSGISGLLSKSPGANRKDNTYFDGPMNTTGQGGPVPFGYGRMIVGGTVISAGVKIDTAPVMINSSFIPANFIFGSFG